MARALINVPRKARRGEVIEIKTLLSHPMETGYRCDSVGSPIPRDIISRFVCIYNGTEVFQACRRGSCRRADPRRIRTSPMP
jgi:sulfur-oxidizing protein SoxZ